MRALEMSSSGMARPSCERPMMRSCTLLLRLASATTNAINSSCEVKPLLPWAKAGVAKVTGGSG